MADPLVPKGPQDLVEFVGTVSFRSYLSLESVLGSPGSGRGRGRLTNCKTLQVTESQPR